MKKVGIVMGSDSDLPVIKKATDTLKALEVERRRRLAALPAAHAKMDSAL